MIIGFFCWGLQNNDYLCGWIKQLEAKQVKMTLTDEAFELLLKEGFTAEYGAREMDRVIAQQLKPLLMREILFGSLKQGGHVTVNVKDGCLAIG